MPQLLRLPRAAYLQKVLSALGTHYHDGAFLDVILESQIFAYLIFGWGWLSLQKMHIA